VPGPGDHPIQAIRGGVAVEDIALVFEVFLLIQVLADEADQVGAMLKGGGRGPSQEGLVDVNEPGHQADGEAPGRGG